MALQRRGFLAGILAAASAPAIVSAGSLMKVIVPSNKIIHAGMYGQFGRGMTGPIVYCDESGWIDVAERKDTWAAFANQYVLSSKHLATQQDILAMVKKHSLTKGNNYGLTA